MFCKHCGSRDITVIGFASNDGAVYRYCRNCETGAWQAGGQEYGTVHALSLASAIEPGRRRQAA